MSKIVKTIAAFLFPACLVFGAYVVLHGHLTPGGGFQGGAVMATAAALLLVAGIPLAAKHEERYHALEALGLGLFLFFAFTGFGAEAGSFFFNALAADGFFGQAVARGPNPGNLHTSGTIAWMNLAVGIEVLGGISVILYALREAARGGGDGKAEGDGK